MTVSVIIVVIVVRTIYPMFPLDEFFGGRHRRRLVVLLRLLLRLVVVLLLDLKLLLDFLFGGLLNLLDDGRFGGLDRRGVFVGVRRCTDVALLLFG